MKSHPVPAAFAALAALASATAAQGSSVTPYGCDAPPASLVQLSGGVLAPGGSFPVGVDNPAGTQAAGSLPFLIASLAPDPAHPCGTPIPGWGMTGPTGELLVDLAAPHFVLSGPPWSGPGQPAPFDVLLPDSPSLLDAHVYLQGMLLDPAGPVTFGLTEGLDLHVPPTGASDLPKPDLTVTAVWSEENAYDVGETVTLRGVVRNVGTGGAPVVAVEACLGDDCVVQPLPSPLAPGEQVVMSFTFATDAGWRATNPHFAAVTADVNDALLELDEANNERVWHKPVFVVDVQYVPPTPPLEHDEIIEIQDGVKVSHTTVVYPNGAPSENFEILDPNKGVFPEPQPGSVPDQPRIDPGVQAADAAAQPGELLEYIVLYEHGVEMPYLPRLPDGSDRFAPANIPVFEERLGLLEATRRLRQAAADNMTAALEQAGGEVLEHYTMAGAMLVRAPKGYLATFDADPTVIHVEPTESAVPAGTVADARDLMDVDPYYSGGATGTGFVAVIDSGVRDTHDLLSSPSHLFFVEDCVSGDSNCNDTGSSAYDPTNDELDHGTAVCAIVTGNTNDGDAYRGFSANSVDSWKVHATGYGDELSTAAILRAYDQAVWWADHIVNCSFSSDAGPSGSLAQGADDMFDAGCVVICANGNDGGGSGTVDSPACAQKVLGVGAYDVDSLSDYSLQSDGPTSDSRYKPDLQAPTYSTTASAASDSWLDYFGGTSSATACVTGAAAVFKDWFGISDQEQADAGKTYAALINSGSREYTEFNNTKGVGPAKLPLDGTLYLGSRNVGRHDNDYVEIDVPSDATKISCAIWWAEDESDAHRDIDLYLLKPGGATSDYSVSSPSVFEHLEVGSPASGTRKVRLYGYSVPVFTSKTTYFAIHVVH